MGFDNDKSSLEDKEYVFQYTAWSCIGIGGLMSIIFHLTIKLDEKKPSKGPQASEDISKGGKADQKGIRPMKVGDWFKEPQFYQVALINMATRYRFDFEIFLGMNLVQIDFFISLHLFPP